jgi:hypothetical protein
MSRDARSPAAAGADGDFSVGMEEDGMEEDMAILSVAANLRQTGPGIAGLRLFIENGKADKLLIVSFRVPPLAATQ